MATVFIEPAGADGARAAERLRIGDADHWLPSDFREVMCALGSELAIGVVDQTDIDAAIIAVEAEEVDDLAQGFVKYMENHGIACHLACFWMRRTAVRDAERKVVGITGTSSQQYLDQARGVKTLIVLQPVAARPDFVEFVIKKFNYMNEIERVILASPIFHPNTLRPAFNIVREKCALEPDVIAFHRVDKETSVLRLTRFGSERLLGTPRSELKKRFFPDFAAYRMDNRPPPKFDDAYRPRFTLRGQDDET